MQKFINERAMGRLPISLPTSIAIETLFGLNENQSNDLSKDKTELWINISTLIRNLVSSLDKETQGIVSDYELANTVMDEMEIIESSVREYSNHLSVKFYIVHYDKLKSIYPNANYRDSVTERKQFISLLYQNTLMNIKQIDTNNKISVFDIDIKPLISSKIVMLTHNAVDLTSSVYFTDVVLLESHTGKLKSNKDWYTKMSTPDKSELLPFTRPILIYFGDSEIFRPQPIKYRRIILETASKFNWSLFTTTERIKLTLGFHEEKLLVNDILKNIH